jgi:hypothetical protein
MLPHQKYVNSSILQPKSDHITSPSEQPTGKKIKITDDFLTVNIMADMVDFCKVSPSIIAANSAITGYEKVDEEGIVIKIKPDIGFEIYAEGDEAKMVKMLFNTELPAQE